MAAVRAGAVGMSRSPRFTLFTSHAHDWKDSEEKKSPNTNEKKGKGYGISLTSAETARTRWKERKEMTDVKLKLCDWTLFVSLFGLVLAMIDVEICASELQRKYVLFDTISFLLRTSIIGSTIILQMLLIAYHWADIRIYLIETGSESWRVGVTNERILKTVLEMAVCAICPIPDTGTVNWPLLGADPILAKRRVNMPLNVLLTLPMFLRLYILGRYIVMHSNHYQDCATRTIASLNHVSVDFRFVIRSQLYSRPLYIVCVFTGCFWMVTSWMLTQCERYAFPNLPGYQHLLDFIWFEIITFFSIGYGDIKVHTYCGRALAMLTAIVGTLFSSILIALMGRRMALSSSEKRVNHLIAESQLTQAHKHAAARVLQNTWRTVLRRREAEISSDTRNMLKLRCAQRGLLKAILSFRRCRWRLRMQMEDEEDYFVARRAFMETEDRLSKVRKRQSQLNNQMSGLYEHVQNLTKLIQVQPCET